MRKLQITLKLMRMVCGKNFFCSSSLGRGGTHNPSGIFLSGSVLPLSEPYIIKVSIYELLTSVTENSKTSGSSNFSKFSFSQAVLVM